MQGIAPDKSSQSLDSLQSQASVPPRWHRRRRRLVQHVICQSEAETVVNLERRGETSQEAAESEKGKQFRAMWTRNLPSRAWKEIASEL